MSNVKLVRFLTGEEVLAVVEEKTIGLQTKVLLKNPIRIVIMPSRDKTSPTIGLAPWIEFSDDKEISVDSAHILAIVNPIKEFVEQYKQTTSKILTPTKNLLLPS